MTPLVAYLVSFALTVWPPRQNDVRHLREVVAIAVDVASTDADLVEATTLMNIAALESTFRVHARGKLGERGPFQVMPPRDPSAAGALSILRAQGLRGYCGCSRACPHTILRRSLPAQAWVWTHPLDATAPRDALAFR